MSIDFKAGLKNYKAMLGAKEVSTGRLVGTAIGTSAAIGATVGGIGGAMQDDSSFLGGAVRGAAAMSLIGAAGFGGTIAAAGVKAGSKWEGPATFGTSLTTSAATMGAIYGGLSEDENALSGMAKGALLGAGAYGGYKGIRAGISHFSKPE